MADKISNLESLTGDINQQHTSLLLNQPLDILFELHRFLPPESCAAFALTCKSAYLTHSYIMAKKARQDLENPQILPERTS
ncbi:hypothetical protein F4813DRAFT_361971 [Daldinia decipiens]|uniref:uncharacterized protein n=1 Tax=Daldinia decipiens TaxID=326647 RepID=UPI0020C28A31|nr:uncharacterized protein F4813DRAFT_361971 [Daldinia decipiens]KAI1656824.1 hypothetical protein F4813DRAFT_361971 [Daldinia decipiens]